MAVNMEDGSSMTSSEFAAVNEISEDLLIYGVLADKLIFDGDGNFTQMINDEIISQQGTYTFNPETHMVTMIMQNEQEGTHHKECEMADILVAGEETTTIAVTHKDINTIMSYAGLP